MSTKNIAAALFKVQGELHGVAKNAQNTHFRNRYATLEAVIETIRPALQAAGLVFLQAPGRIKDGAIEITTFLWHPESDESLNFTMEMPLGRVDPQGTGSAITYALRYSLMAILGIPPVDDDGEVASGRGPKPNGKSDTIDAIQLDRIKGLIVEVGADIGKFCKYMKVARLEDIPAATFQGAVEALEAKRNA